MENESIIEIKNVSLHLKGAMILDEINLDLRKGNIYGLIGRNGSGKTMLMKCICGFIRVTEGEISVEGKRVGRDIDFPDSLGVIIETPGFIPEYSGYKNLAILAAINKKVGKKEICEAMNKVGLDPKMRKPVKKYSLGMKQRLGIAQAVMENPRLLVLDEPMNGLDKEGVADMRRYLLKLKEEGRTILLSSHSAEDIEVLCDEVFEMEHGRII